jgi:hypothetical protein
MMPDDGRLAAILDRLPPADAALIADLIEPQWKRRDRRLTNRDDAVRAARRFFPGMRDTPAATALAQALDRYLATAWRFDRDAAELPQTASAQHFALFRIAQANNGVSIGARQIMNIFTGTRGRWKCNKNL